MAVSYNLVAENNNYTVVAEYEKEGYHAENYQTEADLERAFIDRLTKQGYEYLQIHKEADLIANLRRQLELLNNYAFTDNEWKRFFSEVIANGQDGIVEKTYKIQHDYIQVLQRDDNSNKNIYLLDKENIHNNRLQVINQYTEKKGNHATRYDVTILVNGLPLVHVELKRRGVAIREAFNQINRYQKDSFWAGCGLYNFVQIFVISNGTNTKYYSNTTRISHINEISNASGKSSKKTSNTFEFTSYWADGNNRIINDLVDFTKTFFAKHTLLNILTKYCVFTSENLLLVMRPYQIAATERILNRIEVANNYNLMGSIQAGGYIWHTTGSGKTLTSFKTAQLATKLPYIDKVLFVVDRSDLDYQTMKEYDKFAKGAANSNTSTKILQKQLEDDNVRIIITTIQKLNVFMQKHKSHPVYKKHIVIIFDECHRSQFGQMHQKITKSFKKYHLFGFTGTPIFAKNSAGGKNPLLRTTEQAFGNRLHMYTIVDAINDGNVLPFRIDYINTIKEKDNIHDENISGIDKEKALQAQERISKIVEYILEHFDQKTKRNSFYALKGKRVAGFNSILAVDNISMAIKYYNEFKRQLNNSAKKLTIATIFSFCANEETPDDVLPEEGFEVDRLDISSRDFLERAIAEYNAEFKTDFDTSADKFQNYYKDLSQRVKNREVDLLIVVNMFLTGFDATTLNTLWVDKNLKYHGLIQAFSRTNRILNSVKTYGNIVCFRNLEQETNEALTLFGDKKARGIVLLKSFDDYYYGFEENGGYHKGYVDLVAELTNEFPLGEMIVSENEKKEFVKLFGSILRLRNILTSFDRFKDDKQMSDRMFQDYQSMYIDIYQDMKKQNDVEKENINEDVVFEIELIKQVEVNIDYILMLVAKYHEGNCKDKTVLATIDRAIDSSIHLRSKKKLIHDFVSSINTASHVEDDWKIFVNKAKDEELAVIIKEEKLKSEEAHKFVDNSFRDGFLKTTGTDIDKFMPPVSRFGGGRNKKKKTIIGRLQAFFEKYFGLV